MEISNRGQTGVRKWGKAKKQGAQAAQAEVSPFRAGALGLILKERGSTACGSMHCSSDIVVKCQMLFFVL